MRTTSKLVLFTLLFFTVTSCNKDESNLPFSKQSVEENKTVVEDAAIRAAQAFDQMKEVSVVDAAVSLGIRFDMADPLSAQNAKKSKVAATIDVIAGMEDGSTGINEILSAIASPEELESDPESIQDIWEMVVGTYTWNSGAEDWDYTANANAIVFLFPSIDDGTSNNATLTISNYSGVIISNPLEEEYMGDLPVSINMSLEIDGTEAMSYTFAAAYNEDGVPSSLATDLSLETFVFSIDITNKETEASASYKFMHGDELVMEISGGIEGDFTQESIDANTVTRSGTREDWIWNDITFEYDVVEVQYTWEEIEVEDIIQSGNFSFQLYNIAINGTGDFKALGDSLRILESDDYYEDPMFDEKSANELLASLINNNLHIYAIDKDANKKIADVEAYVVEDVDGNYTYYWIDFRLVFGDDSQVDLETYFEDGFENFIKEINAMISDLNTEYELDIEPIDY
jgi:hypothetical protein